MPPPRTDESHAPESSRQLISWKSIAEYFNCDERTAKRWEHERGMPVHRVPGGKRSGVFAYPAQLDSWLRTGVADPHPHARASSERPKADEDRAGSGTVASSVAIVEAPAPESAHVPSGRRVAFRRWAVWTAAGVACLLAPTAIVWNHIGRKAISISTEVHALSSAARHIPVPGAEELYLRGRYFWNLRTADGLSRALDLYAQAIVKDPSYAEAYASLAETYDLMPQFSQANLGESLTKAKALADRALALNPNLASAHAARAFAMFFWDWDIPGSDAEFKRALDLDPDSAQTHQWYASTLQCRDDGPQAIREIDEALRLNPASAAIAADAALFHADFADFDAGVKALEEIERTQPTFPAPAQFLRELAFRSGDYPAYIREARRYASITRAPDDIALANAIASGWAGGGRIGLLKARIRILKIAFDRGTGQGFALGETLLMMGQPREALRYFRASFDRHSILLITMQDCPWARPLLNDPGYAALLAQVRVRLHGNLPAHPSIVRASIRLPQ